ncbi:hypothetical protein [Mesorhizobium sp. ANAO-SY3R2]|uniref:hypothetical protein n=1 Tax=Mesorhizobium sp. ANAO-SY3R2 TaxID=3166644 RepID=UPI003671001D
MKVDDEPTFSLEIPLTQIGQVMHEVRFASSLMVNRRRRQHDRGAGVLLELIETAMQPQSIEVLIDAATGDRIFVFQFSDHSPLTVRVTAQQSATMLERLAREVARTAN